MKISSLAMISLVVTTVHAQSPPDSNETTSQVASSNPPTGPHVRQLSSYHDSTYEVRMACGVDYPGFDVVTGTGVQATWTAGHAANCYTSCDWFINDCMGAVWTDYNGGTCWYKKSMDVFGTPRGNAKSSAYFKKNTWPDSSFYISPFQNCDMPGNDVGNERQPSVAACAEPCNKRKDCWAWTWTNYNGGTCWFKSQARECVRLNGASSGYMWKLAQAAGNCFGVPTTSLL